MGSFDGPERRIRAGAARWPRCGTSGKRRNAADAPLRPTEGRVLWSPGRVALVIRYPASPAAPLLPGGSPARSLWVTTKDLWYKLPAAVRRSRTRLGGALYQLSSILPPFMGANRSAGQARRAGRDAGHRASAATPPAGRLAPPSGPGAFCRQRRRADLKWPALRRDALLTGGKNRLGERGQYQGPLVLSSTAAVRRVS